MSDKPAEILIEEFLEAKIASAAGDSPLKDAELHDTVWKLITKTFGVRIGDAASQFAPVDGGQMKEFNARLVIICFSEISGKNKKERKASKQKVFEMSIEIGRLITADPSLGGTVCDVVIEEGSRGYDTENNKPFAVANLPIVINQR